ncbi:MAG TPA: hypothetical protein VMW50_12770 [Dehalococcoidia bacterium]|nr:hypothetical protein [Dehalococcoidia bacterium]
MSDEKIMPEWWPTNPYSETIFPMPREKYGEIVPDPKTRTALSGMLGREFWDIASRAIWEAYLDQQDNLAEQLAAAEAGNYKPKMLLKFHRTT